MQWVGPWYGNVALFPWFGNVTYYLGLGMWPISLVWDCDLFLDLGMGSISLVWECGSISLVWECEQYLLPAFTAYQNEVNILLLPSLF